jgi:1-acyl-sn-glycerol-3-phosphate acyltransferase
MKTNTLGKIFRFLHAFLLILWIIVSSVVFGSLVIILRPLSRKISMTLMKVWMLIAIFFSGVRVDISGTEKLDKKRNYIFMSNHVSAADIAIIYAACPG